MCRHHCLCINVCTIILSDFFILFKQQYIMFYYYYNYNYGCLMGLAMELLCIGYRPVKSCQKTNTCKRPIHPAVTVSYVEHLCCYLWQTLFKGVSLNVT